MYVQLEWGNILRSKDIYGSAFYRKNVRSSMLHTKRQKKIIMSNRVHTICSLIDISIFPIRTPTSFFLISSTMF